MLLWLPALALITGWPERHLTPLALAAGFLALWALAAQTHRDFDGLDDDSDTGHSIPPMSVSIMNAERVASSRHSTQPSLHFAMCSEITPWTPDHKSEVINVNSTADVDLTKLAAYKPDIYNL